MQGEKEDLRRKKNPRDDEPWQKLAREVANTGSLQVVRIKDLTDDAENSKRGALDNRSSTHGA